MASALERQYVATRVQLELRSVYDLLVLGKLILDGCKDGATLQVEVLNEVGSLDRRIDRFHQHLVLVRQNVHLKVGVVFID